MKLFSRKHSTKKVHEFDRNTEEIIMHVSICNGERTLFLRNKQTNKSEEIGCVHSAEDLAVLMNNYGFTDEDIKKEY